MVRLRRCDTPVLEDDTDIQDASERLSTFFMWASTSVSAFDLTADGFYYIGVSDFVKCAYCGLVLGEWVPGDKPTEEHRRHYPHCSSLRRGFKEEVKGEDVCGRFETFKDPVAYDPSKAVYKDRLETFNTWPLKLCQNPVNMAASGFFYSGQSDHVQCFYCGLKIDSWERKEDPWVEHTLNCPTSGYIQSCQGTYV